MKTYYVNVYEVDRAYGGPEEGGWWFEVGELIKSEGPFQTRSPALVRQEALRERFPHTGKRASVLGGEDYEVVIEDYPGRDYPEIRPHYE